MDCGSDYYATVIRHQRQLRAQAADPRAAARPTSCRISARRVP